MEENIPNYAYDYDQPVLVRAKKRINVDDMDEELPDIYGNSSEFNLVRRKRKRRNAVGMNDVNDAMDPEVLQRIGVLEHPRARMMRKIRERNAAAQSYPFTPPEEVELLRKVPAHPTLRRNLENTIMKNLPVGTIVTRNWLKSQDLTVYNCSHSPGSI